MGYADFGTELRSIIADGLTAAFPLDPDYAFDSANKQRATAIGAAVHAIRRRLHFLGYQIPLGTEAAADYAEIVDHLTAVAAAVHASWDGVDQFERWLTTRYSHLGTGHVMIEPRAFPVFDTAEQMIFAARRICGGNDEVVVEMERSWTQSVLHLIRNAGNGYDGPLEIYRDSDTGLFWQHPKSGLHGGLIFHKSIDRDGATVGTWSIHT